MSHRELAEVAMAFVVAQQNIDRLGRAQRHGVECAARSKCAAQQREGIPQTKGQYGNTHFNVGGRS